MNDYEVMVVRREGEFVWHSHPDTDDLFLVLDGELDIELLDGAVTLGPGELYVDQTNRTRIDWSRSRSFPKKVPIPFSKLPRTC